MPWSAREAHRKQRLVARRAQCDPASARYYLDAADGDVGRALALHAEDAAWEAAVLGPSAASAEETAELPTASSASTLATTAGQCSAAYKVEQTERHCAAVPYSVG